MKFTCLLILFFSLSLFAQSNDDCLMCHSDDSMEMEKNGKTLSLYVDEAVFENTPHKKLQCVSCHIGFDPEELPHKENIQAIDCMTCHKDAKVKHLFHAQLMTSDHINGSKDVNCKSCHGTHNVKSYQSYSKKDLNTTCITCHENDNNVVNASAHFSGGKSGAFAPDCYSCHSKQVTNLSFGGNNSRKKIAQENLCLSCHKEGNSIGLTSALVSNYTLQNHSKLIHQGKDDAAGCVDCHSSHNIGAVEILSEAAKKDFITATCQKCHSDVAKEFEESSHGKILSGKDSKAPSCYDCHNEHNEINQTAQNSSLIKSNKEKSCLNCHEPVSVSEKFSQTGKLAGVFTFTYHGVTDINGTPHFTNCSSCHGAHNIKPANDPLSAISKERIPETCGNCHPGAEVDFTSSTVHVTAAGAVITPKVEVKEESSSWFYYLLILLVIVGAFVAFKVTFKGKSKETNVTKNEDQPVIKKNDNSDNKNEDIK